MSGLYNFDGADTDPLPSPWASATGWGTLRRLSNQCANSAGSDTDAAMRRTDSSATLSKVEFRSGTFDGGPAHLDSSGNGYITTSYSGVHVEFYRVAGGPNYTKVGNNHSVTFAAGDTGRLDIDGDDLVFYKNDVEVGRETDTTYRTGLTPSIFEYAANLRVDNHTDGQAGGQTINVGLSSETDSAFSVGHAKFKAVGLTTETDSAFAVGTMSMVPVGLASETDSAISVGKFKSKVVGLAGETDSALDVTVGAPPSSYSTSFPLTENPLNEGGMWRVGSVTSFYKNPRTTPGKCFAADFVGAGFDDCLAHLTNHSIPVDQRITATVFRATSYNPSETHEFGLYLHMVIGAEFVRGYEFLFNTGGGFQVVLWLGTAHDLSNFDTSITLDGPGPGTLADGDQIAVQVHGTRFDVFKNGTPVGGFTDSTFTDGNPGLGFFVRSGDTTLANFGISSWAAESSIEMIDIGMAVESDSAFSVGRSKSRAVGLAAETDSAIVVRPTSIYSVGLASESSSAFSVACKKSRSLGLAFEADQALSVIGGQQSGGGGYRHVRLGLGLG